MSSRGDMALHIFDFLVQLVVLVKQPGEMMVSRLESGDQVTIFRKHFLSSLVFSFRHFTEAMKLKPAVLSLAMALFLAQPAAKAIDLLPDDLIAPPIGLSSLQLAYVDQRRTGVYQKGQEILPRAEYNYEQWHVRYARSFDWDGHASVAYVQLPYYKVHTENIAFGPVRATDAPGGLGDIVLLLATWLHNDPLRGHYAGIGGYLFVPTGEYEAEKTRLVNTNPGSNRWRAALQFGHYFQLSKKIGWMAAFDTVWSGKNTEAYWTSPTLATRRQEPFNTFQTGLMYGINSQLSLGLNYFYSFGGRTSLNGIKNDDATHAQRYQITTSYFVSPGARLLLQYGSEFKTENGFKETGTTSLSITQYF